MALQYINITSGTETYKSTYNKINNNLSEQFVSGSYSNELLNLYRFDGSIYTISGFTGSFSGITSNDIITALGYTPYDSTNPNLYISSITSSNIIDALGYVPLSSVTNNSISYSGLTVTGDVSGSTLTNNLILTLLETTIGNTYNNITYNNKGLVISGENVNYIQSSFTESNYYKLDNPNQYINFSSGDTKYYLNTNPSNYISSITFNNVTTALGYVPYNSNNISGFTTSSFTENRYYKLTNPSNYISSITFNNVTNALGYVPLSSVTNNTISYSGLTVTGDATGSTLNNLINLNLQSVTIGSTVGSSTLIPVIQYDNKGRILSAYTVTVVSSNSSGITSINNNTNTIQTLITGNTGDNFNINSVGGVHTFNLPNSSSSNRGLLTPTDWSNFNSKNSYSGLTVSGDMTGSTNNNQLILTLPNIVVGNLFNNITYNSKGLVVSGNNINYITSSFTESTYYKLTNPNNYISSITSSNITTGLGYTPYNSNNPSGFTTSSFTESNYYKLSNPNNYISSITSANITTALGYVPLSSSTSSGRINIIDFGVNGDGTDESVNMQTAINSGLPLYIPSNMVIRANGLICTTDLDVEGYGTILNKYSSVTLTWRPSWGVQTNVNGVITSTTRVVGGGFVSKIPVVNTSGFTINRVCQIRSQDIYSFAGATSARKAELFRILDIENGFIWVHGLIEDDYPTNPIIQELPTNKCYINGLTFSADGDIYNIPTSPEEAAVIIQGSVDAFINIKVDTCWTRGLFMLSDFNSMIRVVARNIRDYTNNNQYGYGVSLAGSSHGANVYVDAEKCRHAITSNIYTDFGPAWNGTARKATVSGVARRMLSAAWDTHPGAMNWTFRNIISIDGEYDRDTVGAGRRQGFQDRGFQTIVDGLQIIGQTDGIYYDNIDYGKQNISTYRNVTIKYKDQINSIDGVAININGEDPNSPKIIIENWNTDRVRETLRTVSGVSIVMRNCYFGETVSMDLNSNDVTLENITRQNSNIIGSDVMDNISFDNNALIRADSIRHFGDTKNGGAIFRGYGTLSGTTNLYLGSLTNWYTETSALYYNPNNMIINITDTQVPLPQKYIQIPENTTQSEITSGMVFMQNGIPKGRFLSETMNSVMYRASSLVPSATPKFSGQIWGKTGSSNDIWIAMNANSVSDWKKIQLVAGGTTSNRPTSGETYEMYFDTTLGKPIWRDGTNTLWVEPSTKLNNQTGITQTLVTGNTGNDFNIISSGNTHTFNIPSSSGTNRGLLTSIDWNTFNNKVSYSGLTVSGDVTGSTLTNQLTLTLQNIITPAIVGSGSQIPVIQYDNKGRIISSYTVTIVGGSSGITSINNQTNSIQDLVTGNTGTDFNINSVGGVHTFNLPTAFSSTTRGLLSGIDWSNFNNKQNNLGYTPLSSITLTGDINGSGLNSVVTTLASITTGATVGSSTQIPIIIFDNKGRITSATTVTVNASGGELISGLVNMNFGNEEDYAYSSITNVSITNSGLKSISFIPIENSTTSFDDFKLNGVSFMLGNIVDNTSFEIIGTAINNASGIYTVKYLINI
jgi:hypothetical protein